MLSGMDNSLGERVKAARLQRRWTVARAAREAGIDRTTWQRIEDGHQVQEVKLYAVLQTLEIAPDVDAATVEAATYRHSG